MTRCSHRRLASMGNLRQYGHPTRIEEGEEEEAQDSMVTCGQSTINMSATRSTSCKRGNRNAAQLKERSNQSPAVSSAYLNSSPDRKMKFVLLTLCLLVTLLALAVNGQKQATSSSSSSSKNTTTTTNKTTTSSSEHQPSNISSSSPGGNRQHEPLEQQATELRSTSSTTANSNGTQQHLEDLIAFGRITLASDASRHQQQLTAEQSRDELARVSAEALRHAAAASGFSSIIKPQNGRLVDRIAEIQRQQQQRARDSKLDYIIEFLRQNKLSKFCDLLTQPSGRVRELIKQLDGMQKFTLFVPTNEALLLMPSGQYGALADSPDETRRFLMAHATSELVVPRLATDRAPAPSGQSRWHTSSPSDKRIVQQGASSSWQQSASLIYSLAGSPLRIVTTPAPNANSSSTRLELIVNGANVLSGHSHALQEPNNTSVTYAIVHLIDRTLYPSAQKSVYERIQAAAPKFAKLLRATQDVELLERLESTRVAPATALSTAFVPSDDAIRTMPTKLLDQLETNRTLLQNFIRTHLVDGLFYSGQLASPLGSSPVNSSNEHHATTAAAAATNHQIPRLLTSMSGADLEFESKVLQSRQLILVNSIPITDQDLVALNGVVHVIVRPLVERSLLDDACNCESKLQADNSTADWLREKGLTLDSDLVTTPTMTTTIDVDAQALGNTNDNSLDESSQVISSQTPASRQQRLAPSSSSNWFRGTGPQRQHPVGSSNQLEQRGEQLEREESQHVNSNLRQATGASPDDEGRALRSQRSGDQMLVARNNRDFYRPSAAPVNLILQDRTNDLTPPPQERQLTATAVNNNTSSSSSSRNSRLQEAGAGDQVTRPQPEQLQGQPATVTNWTNGQRAPLELSGNQVEANSDASPLPLSSFEVERYKVVMNATMRQRLREQQQQAAQRQQQLQQQQSAAGATGLIMSSSLQRHQQQQQQPARSKQQQLFDNNNLFVYDQPLATPPSAAAPRHWTYSAAPVDAPNFVVPSDTNSAAGAGSGAHQPQSVNNQQQQPSAQDQVGSSASTQRHQRLLKFQAEDARDPWLQNNNNESQQQQQHAASKQHETQARQSGTSKVAAAALANFAGCAFYDADCKRLQMGGKLVRLPARSTQASIKQTEQQPLVLHNGTSNVNSSQQLVYNYQMPMTTPSSSDAFDTTFGETTKSSVGAQLSRISSAQPLSIIRPRPQVSSSVISVAGLPHPPALPKNYVSISPPGALKAARISPLNQPLPPWSDDEHKQHQQQHQVGEPTITFKFPAGAAGGGQVVSNYQISNQQQQQPPTSIWRAHDVADLTRISGINLSHTQRHQSNFSQLDSPTMALTKTSSQQQQQQQRQQVLLVPVKMFQDSNISLASGQRLLASTPSAQNRPIFFGAAPTSPGDQVPPTRAPSVTFSANSQYFTPTMQPQLAAQLQQQQQQQLQGPRVTFGRLANLTALEPIPMDDFDAGGATSGQLPANHKQQSTTFISEATPARKQSFFIQQQQQQQQLRAGAKLQPPVATYASAAAGSFHHSNDTSHSSALQNAIKHARKIVRLQTSPMFQQQQQQQEPFDYVSSGGGGGDISVTSAKLSARPTTLSATNNYTSAGSGALAVQASNQSPDVSGLSFAPSAATSSAAAAAAAASSVDFFQDRTIAEIMDDSGLRIDGQQVTFNRLRGCLEQAGLSNLITQQESALTIFMPTDSAFQRLVQAQALMQQRNTRSGSAGSAAVVLSSAARLSDRRHLLPLIASVSTSRTVQPAVAANSGNSITSANDAPPSSSGRLQAVAADLAVSATDSPNLSLLGQRLTLDCSTQQVRQLLLDHLSSQLIMPKQLQSDSVLNSLSGKRLLLSSVPSKKIVVVDGQPVIAATRAKNGMVYVVNKFLNVTQQMPSVIELLESQPQLKTFLSYLSFSSLTDRLKRETGPITILAPTNEAFDQLSSSARQLLNSDPAAMMDILRGHILEGAQFGKLVSMRNRLKTLNSDHFIDAKVIKPNLYQLDNQVTSIRLVGTSGNGVVNAIDRIIVPAWLSVSQPAASRPATLSDVNNQLGRSILELDDTRNTLLRSQQPQPSNNFVGASRGQTAALNLPSLNNQPLRFEQPNDAAARLAPPSSNSFSLAGTTTTSTTTEAAAASADSFGDVPNSTGSNSIGNDNPLAQSSPFLRLAGGGGGGGNQTTTLPGSRLAPQTTNPADERDFTGTNSLAHKSSSSTKNMALIDKLAGLMKARKFVKYLLRSRLSELLKPDMNYVILVPTDQAIERLPKQITDMLEREPERLSDLVNFHVLDTTFEYINTIPDGQTLNTLNEKDILFNWHRNNTILTASGAVVLGGIQEENIALLIVDRVLYPTPGDLLSIVTKSPILSNFTQLIRNAGLERQLSLAGPFTLFAPSDFAFNQLDRRDIEFLSTNRESARRFLLRHLSQPAVFTSSIALSNTTFVTSSTTTTSGGVNKPLASGGGAPQLTITNLLGEDLALKQKNDYFSVNDVNFSYADVAATNGVVHVIDGLL